MDMKNGGFRFLKSHRFKMGAREVLCCTTAFFLLPSHGRLFLYNFHQSVARNLSTILCFSKFLKQIYGVKIAKAIKTGVQITSGMSVKWNVAVQSPATIIFTPTSMLKALRT